MRLSSNMMKLVAMGTVALAVTLGCAGGAKASFTPLTLDYSVTDLGGGQFKYDFDLILDNHSGNWAAGQGWDWFIFGDTSVLNGSSPLTDFQMAASSFPVGPWTTLQSSSGSHNGPTFGPVLGAFWVPTAVGDDLKWSGTSTANLAQGQLLFSTLQNENGATAANFDVADRLEPAAAPEPASLTLLGIGCVGLIGYAGLRRRKARRTACAA